jgi:hypothetical protein
MGLKNAHLKIEGYEYFEYCCAINNRRNGTLSWAVSLSGYEDICADVRVYVFVLDE